MATGGHTARSMALSDRALYELAAISKTNVSASISEYLQSGYSVYEPELYVGELLYVYISTVLFTSSYMLLWFYGLIYAPTACNL